ncbi:hypothetical protein B0T25DRAFT_560550 [Lasiosphaeria hispida]|uniref:Secreted protein n=1 Tax=Lasiosphaeria hispida TaxID=260671 RepID=A0AAJ0H567_9PEZI|nr:hypothetical protein B0T25DRAFT_560550 [Lasiosphaeria hispida]
MLQGTPPILTFFPLCAAMSLGQTDSLQCGKPRAARKRWSSSFTFENHLARSRDRSFLPIVPIAPKYAILATCSSMPLVFHLRTFGGGLTSLDVSPSPRPKRQEKGRYLLPSISEDTRYQPPRPSTDLDPSSWLGSPSQVSALCPVYLLYVYSRYHTYTSHNQHRPQPCKQTRWQYRAYCNDGSCLRRRADQ